MTKKVGTKNAVKPHFWSDEEKLYLKKIVKGKTTKEIQQLMTEKFKYVFSHNQITGAMKRYKYNSGYNNFYKGHIPVHKGTKGIRKPNSGSFKKGKIPSNKKPIGSERKRDSDGYIEIKVDEKNRWALKQRYLYEKYNNCKLDKNEVVLFADKNKLNFDKDNLIKVTRNQMRVINQNNLIRENKELTEVGINIANILIKTYELKNRK